MKTIQTKLIIVLLAFAQLFHFSCSFNSESKANTESKMTNYIPSNSKANTTNHDLPEIQNRVGKLAETSEWPKIKEEAQNLYQKVRTTGDAKSALYLAAIYMQEARITGDHPYYYNAAIDVLDLVLENPPKNKNLHYQALTSKASVMLSQHNFTEALELGKQALNIEQKDAQVYGVLCDANVELGNYTEAVKMSDKMISIKPDLRSYARISYLRELHGDFDGAVEAMNLAISAGIPGHENTAWARNTLAEMYMNYGKYELANNQLQLCIKERPTYAFALANLASLELDKGNLDQAEKTIDDACEMMPEFSFYVTKAKIQKLKGENSKFEKSRNDLLEMMKEDTESGHNMSLETANIYLELFEDPDKAFSAMKKESLIRPNNIEINKMLGEIHFKSKDYDKAKNYFEMATKTNWNQPSFLCLKGLALCETGNKVEGSALLKRAINSGAIKDIELITQSKSFLN